MFSGKTKINVLVTASLWCIAFPFTTAAQQVKVQDSITIAISPGYDSVTRAHRFFLGEGYRKLWATPVKMRIVSLGTERGGMKILQVGGGQQTRSLRLQDSSGREWALRTVQKYPERALPEKLRATIAKDIVRDQIVTSHPFSSLIVPPLAAALGVPHANPEIIYIGDDPALGTYRKEYANAVYLLEDRSPSGYEESDNTLKVQRKTAEDNDTQVDQKLVLRARLLDFVLGDWDRHEDNWRWVKVEEKGEKVYLPVPRDRDMVLYKSSGVFPWIVSHQWLQAKHQPYAPEIRAVDQWNFNQRYFDRYFLNGLSEDDWQKEIKFVQDTFTPELLRKAMLQLPPAIFAEGGEASLNMMIARVHHLDKNAVDYYRFLSKVVEVPTSDKKEHFEIRHKANGDIELTIHNIKKNGDQGRKLYHRNFNHQLTEEIRLYGMAGEDVFDVTGEKKSPIIVRLIGGDDKDRFQIGTQLKRNANTYIYDRSDELNDLPAASAARLRLSTDTAVNQYNGKSFVYNQFGPLVHVNYNIDQGIQAGVGLIIEKQGFRRYPYASKQEFWVDYSTGRSSFILNYKGDFKKVMGSKTNLMVNANLLGPNNLSNFFGLGNNSQFIRDDDDDDHENHDGSDDDDDDDDDDKGMSYYRNRYDYLTTDLQLYQKFDKWTVGGGIDAEFYTSSRSGNDERFLHDFNITHPEEEVFKDRVYAGLIGTLNYDSRDNVTNPKKGIYWNTVVMANQQLNNGHERYGKIKTEFRYYLNPGHGGLVIANRLGGGTTIGDPVFFQMMQLGGLHNLRGFHTNRFTGKTMAYYNLDLRLKLFDFTSYLVPGSFGLLGFNDIGRVWQKGESSKSVHYGYGGGIYVVPADLILIQAAAGFSKESTMPYISIGFNF
jgi:hypothetical protein